MMGFEVVSLVLLILLGGVVAIDGTSFGQFMVSRPFVAAALAGGIVGRPAEGAIIGLVLEAFNLNILPVGASKYPEGGPAAVAGGASYAMFPEHTGNLLVAVLLVLGLEWVGGESIRYLRQTNRRYVPVNQKEEIDPERLERSHRLTILRDFGRGMVLAAVGIVILTLAIRTLTPFWGLGERIPQLVAGSMVAGLLASTLRIVGSRAWFTAAGIGAGLTFLFLVR